MDRRTQGIFWQQESMMRFHLRKMAVLLPPLLGGCSHNVTFFNTDESGVFKNAMDFLTSTANCWSCSIVGYMFGFVQNIVDDSAESLRGGAASLLAAGYAIWLALHVLKSLRGMAFGEPTLGKDFWKDFNTRLLCVLLGTALLASPSAVKWALETTVMTVLQAFVNLGQTVIASVLDTVTGNGAEDFKICAGMESPSIDGLKANMSCLLAGMHRLMMNGVGLGFRLIRLQNPPTVLVGGLFIAMFVFFSIAFPFYVLDAVFRMTFMIALTPVFIVAWVFPATRKYAKTAFNSFLGIGVQLCFISMYMTFSTVTLYSVMASDARYKAYIGPNAEEIAEEQGARLAAMASSGGGEEAPLFVLFILGLYLFRLSGKVAALAGEFVGTLGPDMFSDMLNKLVSVAIKAASFAVPGGAVAAKAAKAVKKAMSKKGQD
jgi:hypothetical protein